MSDRSQHPRRRRAAAGLLGLLALASIACGPSTEGRVPLAPARGLVLFDGEPAAGVELRLHPDPPRPDGLTPVARTHDDGTFALTTYEGEDGAPTGEYRVALVWPEDDVPSPRPDRLKGKYRDPARTAWRATIKEGPNTLETIEIPAGPAPAEAARKAGPARKSHDGPRSREPSKPGGT